MSDTTITNAIPHRGSMLLVDEIVEQSGDSIVCRKQFRAEEFFFDGHYPDRPIVPGVILCEAGMQAGAILLSQHVNVVGGDKMPVATRMNDVKFKRIVQPGEEIMIAVTLDERLADAFFLTAKVTCEGKLAARFSFACAVAAI